jgi:predicted ATPase
MITRFHIENFKSLAKFDLPAEPNNLGMFSCLIGLNGSGKSTVLQALDFAAHVVSGTVKEWLAQRDWKAMEVVSNLSVKRSPVVTIKFDMQDTTGAVTIDAQDANSANVCWEARYNVIQGRCTYEKIAVGGRTVLELSEGRLSFADSSGRLNAKFEKMDFVYEGSILSLLQLSDAHSSLKYVKNTLGNLKSLELLSPHQMRRRARLAPDMGAGGEKLSGFLSGLSADKKRSLLCQLQRFYPALQDLQVKSLRSGWKSLWVEEQYSGRHSVEATHMNDGMLRVLAILSETLGDHDFLLFDEIENGINPELVERLMDWLRACGKQVVVTTHSPMILNYIPDDVARESVHLLYKNRRGETQAIRYFDLERTKRKLMALGPGEVFADTKLTELVAEIDRAAADQGTGEI